MISKTVKIATWGWLLPYTIINYKKGCIYTTIFKTFLYIYIIDKNVQAYEVPKCQESIGCMAGVTTII